MNNDQIKSQTKIQTSPVLTEKADIMTRYIKLKAIAYSYWHYFTYSLGYILIFPVIQKLSHTNNVKKFYIFSNVIGSLFFAYIFYRLSIKRVLKIFNNDDYENFVLFCKKYKLEEELLL